MGRLSLRTRLLAGIGVVLVAQALAAVVVIRTTRDHLVDQIDDRLAAADSPERDGRFDGDDPTRPESSDPPPAPDDGERPERLGDVYEGVLRPDGTLVTIFAPNTSGSELAPPAVDVATAPEANGEPVTVDAADGTVRYRLAARALPDGDLAITAIPLADVDDTLDRLTAVMAAAAVLIVATLALVAWWMLRLGIRPVKRMTLTAEAIAAGDLTAGELSERIDHADHSTEAGRLGTALNHMLQRIDDSFAQRARAEDKLRRFVADASHELRTPVTTIRGYAELYRTGALTDREALDDAMRRTEQESLRMARLIDDMLALAKLDRDPSVTTRRVDISSLVADAVADARAVQPDRPIDADVPGADPLTVDGDEDLLRQVLANVIGNALVHTDPTDAVRVVARRAGTEEDDAIVVEIVDDGPGMSPEFARRATERFVRADPARTRHRGGSGLGLSIVESAMRSHGGHVDIVTSPGRGTTVRLTLPNAAPVV